MADLLAWAVRAEKVRCLESKTVARLRSSEVEDLDVRELYRVENVRYT